MGVSCERFERMIDEAIEMGRRSGLHNAKCAIIDNYLIGAEGEKRNLVMAILDTLDEELKKGEQEA